MTDARETRYPVTDYLAEHRAPFAGALLVLGVAFGLLGLAAVVGKTGLVGSPGGAETKEKDPEAKDKPSEGPTDPEKAKAADAAKVDFAVSGVSFLFAGLCLVAVGVWVRGRPPGALTRTDARTAALAAGGSLGFFLMLLGLWLVVSWFQPLAEWLDKGDRRGAKWPVLAVAIFVAGGAIAFASVQPARAEERTNASLRRIVYGFNLALSTVLLVVLLAAVNVFVSLRVPNALDTTEGGFYTFELSEATKEYLGKLDRPVTAYVTIPRGSDDHIARETFRLLDACAAANPDRFKVRPLGVQDKDDFNRLIGKFPQSGLSEERGILLVAGADEAEFAFVREGDLSESRSGRGRDVFQGEARLARELLFLAEGKVKAAVYFTAGSGELSISPEDRAPRSALRLKALLEKNNVEVRTLTVGLQGVKIPDDATAVVVADPTGPLAPPLVEAIQQYMTKPRANGKPGKLVVLAGPHPVQKDKGVAATGLEDVLASFGVRLVPGYLLNQSVEFGYDTAAVLVNAKLIADRNPIAQSYSGLIVPFKNSRPLRDAGIPGGKFTATPLFVTQAKRFSWVEPDPTTDVKKAVAAMQASEALQRERDLSPAPRALAMVVTEGEVGRAVVFGCGDLFDDRMARSLDSLPAELFANTVDWLRDRPAVANIANKTYGTYTPKPNAGDFRGEILPVGLVLFAVLALGTGVWVTRRT